MKSASRIIVQVPEGTDLMALEVTLEFANGTLQDFQNGVAKDYTNPCNFLCWELMRKLCIRMS